ncbi:MAG TPA: DUF5103 domain-containing protein [Bacteroidales bacterium]|nr:DUF5103 domain-containing protein [Bacteroidales bacterium]
MYPRINFLAVCILLQALISLNAQVYQTGTRSEIIKTLTVNLDGDWAALPVLYLGSDSKIGIGFDELSHDYKRYAYRIIHCNSDWKRSEMSPLEYMDGFPENDLENGEPSKSTLTLYTHYALTIPNDNVKLLLSGNYVVEIFDKDGSGEAILTACFVVCENKSIIDASLTATTDIDFKQKHQQLRFALKPIGLSVIQPLNELKIVVQQNHRRDTEVRYIAPTSINGDQLNYDHNKDLIFEGGNEYRRFEMTSFKYPGLHVNRIEYFKPFYNVELLPTDKRTEGYAFDRDQNGRYLIHSQEAMDDVTGSDYFLVHFSIPMENPLLDGGFYLNGDFVYNRQDANSKLTYRFESKAYEKTLLLKQGAYNFQYVFKPTKDGRPSSNQMEGSYWQTENEYQIFVYYHPVGERYDRLIGFKQVQTTF